MTNKDISNWSSDETYEKGFTAGRLKATEEVKKIIDKSFDGIEIGYEGEEHTITPLHLSDLEFWRAELKKEISKGEKQ